MDSPPRDKTSNKSPAPHPEVDDVERSNTSALSSDQESGSTHKSEMSTGGQGTGWPSAGFDKRTNKQRSKVIQRDARSSDDLRAQNVGKVDKKEKRCVKNENPIQ